MKMIDCTVHFPPGSGLGLEVPKVGTVAAGETVDATLPEDLFDELSGVASLEVVASPPAAPSAEAPEIPAPTAKSARSAKEKK